jgi:hypothetical protein
MFATCGLGNDSEKVVIKKWQETITMFGCKQCHIGFKLKPNLCDGMQHMMKKDMKQIYKFICWT